MNKTKAYKLALLTKKYVGLYQDDDTGLCGIGHDAEGGYVQITEESFAELVKAFPDVEWKVEKRGEKEFPYLANMILWETQFLTVGTRKEFKNVGLL